MEVLLVKDWLKKEKRKFSEQFVRNLLEADKRFRDSVKADNVRKDMISKTNK